MGHFKHDAPERETEALSKILRIPRVNGYKISQEKWDRIFGKKTVEKEEH